MRRYLLRAVQKLSLLRHTGNPLNPPPLHTQTQAPPPPPTLALGLTPHTSTSSPSTRHHSCAEAYDCSQRYMNTLVVLSHHGAAASSSRPGLRAHPAPPPTFLRSLSDKLLGKAKTRAKQKIRRTQAKPLDCKTRQRDPKSPSPSTVMDVLLAKRSSYNTWMRFVASNERNKRSKGVYLTVRV